MAANPQMVATDITVTWDHVPQRIPRGTVIDVPPQPGATAVFSGLLALTAPPMSALELALGPGNLVPLTAQQRTGDGGSSLVAAW